MNNLNIYEFLKLLDQNYIHISVYIDEYCGLDEWSVHIYEGYNDEFICNIYDLNKYHITNIHFTCNNIVQIYLEEN